MKIRDYRNHFVGDLESLYDKREAESFFYMTLEDLQGWRRHELALHPNAAFSSEALSQWNSVLDRLKKEVPIQYILGKAHFFGLEFEVNQNVLIPRPETEELVDWIIANARPAAQPVRILDIGTGSGCIAISLAKNLTAKVSAIDVSLPALEIAMKNAAVNNAAVSFIQKDILQTQELGERFDIIVSNPPYVRQLEKAEIRKNVLENEPHLALFVDDNDALLFYRKIAELALKNLAQGGSLYFEINQYLAKQTMDMLEGKGFGYLELRQDIYGNDRMILAKV